jgi:hypothetical protein
VVQSAALRSLVCEERVFETIAFRPVPFKITWFQRAPGLLVITPLSPSILQTAEASNPDSKHAGLFRILALLAPIDFFGARAYLKRWVRERIVQLYDTLPDHMQEVRSTVVDPYTSGPSSVSQDFSGRNLTKGSCEKPRSK